jgi:hypothetical protein
MAANTKTVTMVRNGDGKWTFQDKTECAEAFAAIVNSFTKEELVDLKRCPMCNQKTSFKPMTYRPSRHMVEVLFEMYRVMNKDPEGRRYVKLTEEPKFLKDEEQLIGMTSGIKQIHKMIYLGLVSFVDHSGNPTTKNDPDRKLGCYTISQKGMDLISGKDVVPWQTQIVNGRIHNAEANKNTKGNIHDVRNIGWEEWIEMAKSSGLENLEIPKAIKEKQQDLW